MDCHVFRRLCDELAPALMGCRIEKIHRPAKDVTLFTLYGTGGKRFLFLRAGRKAPFLFLSTHKIPVGSAPPADIMRLRKYLADRRIIDVLPDWVGRPPLPSRQRRYRMLAYARSAGRPLVAFRRAA